ncbi:hypothetical protein OIU74_027766, partial [Salix koriyanagi]
MISFLYFFRSSHHSFSSANHLPPFPSFPSAFLSSDPRPPFLFRSSHHFPFISSQTQQPHQPLLPVAPLFSFPFFISSLAVLQSQAAAPFPHFLFCFFSSPHRQTHTDQPILTLLHSSSRTEHPHLGQIKDEQEGRRTAQQPVLS